jgi:hypothetical protein
MTPPLLVLPLGGGVVRTLAPLVVVPLVVLVPLLVMPALLLPVVWS